MFLLNAFFAIIIVVVFLVPLVRNKFVFDCRILATEMCNVMAKRVIHETNNGDQWKRMYDILDSYPSYSEMLFKFPHALTNQ